MTTRHDGAELPKVSVIMAVFKEDWSILQPALESILTQDYPNIELIIVVDNPEYKSLNLLTSLTETDGRIRMRVNAENIGLAQSLNKGLRYASGKIICRMDADDVSHTERISRQVRHLVDNDLDLIGGQMRVISQEGEFLYSTGSLPKGPNEVNRALVYNNCLPHPTWLGKREVFAEEYRAIPLCEDYDFLLRAALHGYKLGNIQEEVLDYRMTSSSLSRSNLYEQFLYQQYLSKEYRRKRSPEVDEAVDFVHRKKDGDRALKYVKANTLFNRGLSLVGANHYLKGTAIALRACLTSADYARKVSLLAKTKFCQK